jgi:hypothetical protein
MSESSEKQNRPNVLLNLFCLLSPSAPCFLDYFSWHLPADRHLQPLYDAFAVIILPVTTKILFLSLSLAAFISYATSSRQVRQAALSFILGWILTFGLVIHFFPTLWRH